MPDTETAVSETTNTTVVFQEPIPVADDDQGGAEEHDNTAAEPTEDTPHGELGDGGTKAIHAEREARKAAEKQLREVRAALKEYEDRDKTELQLLREKAEAAEQRAVQAEQERLRQKVASEKGVPASRLAGTTEDELMAAADELLAWREQSKTPPPPKRVPTTDGLKSGASGVENTNPDLKSLAAEKLRRLRAGG